MCNQDSKKLNSDIAIEGSAVLAKLFGVIHPGSATIGIILDTIKERRNAKYMKRLERLIQLLNRRITKLECKSEIVSDPDLLDEIISKAVSDEEEGKTRYYAGLIEYYATSIIEAYEFRLLGEALKALTIDEITSFAEFASGGNYLRNLPESLKDVFWVRVEFLGLYKGGSAKYVTQITKLGKKFLEIHHLAMAN